MDVRKQFNQNIDDFIRIFSTNFSQNMDFKKEEQKLKEYVDELKKTHVEMEDIFKNIGETQENEKRKIYIQYNK